MPEEAIMLIQFKDPIGALVEYHGSIVEYHGFYTVKAVQPARGPAHMTEGNNAFRLVLVQDETVLSNVRPESVTVHIG
jgi:hypothetical protein